MRRTLLSIILVTAQLIPVASLCSAQTIVIGVNKHRRLFTPAPPPNVLPSANDFTTATWTKLTVTTPSASTWTIGAGVGSNHILYQTGITLSAATWYTLEFTLNASDVATAPLSLTFFKSGGSPSYITAKIMSTTSPVFYAYTFYTGADTGFQMNMNNITDVGLTYTMTGLSLHTINQLFASPLDFTTASWTKAGNTASTYLLTQTAGTGDHNMSQASIAVSASTTYTITIFAATAAGDTVNVKVIKTGDTFAGGPYLLDGDINLPVSGTADRNFRLTFTTTTQTSVDVRLFHNNISAIIIDCLNNVTVQGGLALFRQSGL